jgi:hypothetical protein
MMTRARMLAPVELHRKCARTTLLCSVTAGALRSGAAIFYMALNVAASVIALGLIRVFDWRFGVTAGGAALRWMQVAVAGTAAMALFRTSLFTIHAADRDIGVGPGSFLQIFRDAADRATDRLRARARGEQVSKLMDGISVFCTIGPRTPHHLLPCPDAERS